MAKQAIPERICIPECHGASSRYDCSPISPLSLIPHDALLPADVRPEFQLLVIVVLAIEQLRISRTAVGIAHVHQSSTKEVATLVVLSLVAMVECNVCRETYAKFFVIWRSLDELVIARFL
jgi:hypothetical protein